MAILLLVAGTRLVVHGYAGFKDWHIDDRITENPMSLPTNKDARRIGSRIDSGSSDQVDRFATSVHSPMELKFWMQKLNQMIKRRKQNLMSIGISDDRFTGEAACKDV